MSFEITENYIHERRADRELFDDRSFRPKKQRNHTIVFGCPRGRYDSSSGRCLSKVRIHKILHPIEEFKEKCIKKKCIVRKSKYHG